MRDETYLIQKSDYIRHINDKTKLYVMLRRLGIEVAKLPVNRGSKELSQLSAQLLAEAEEMFRSWCIAKSYLAFHKEEGLAVLMDNELVAPEDGGYVPCDCLCSGCPAAEDYEFTDDEEDIEDDEDSEDDMEAALFADMMESVSEILHNMFGNGVSIHIVVE